MHTPWHRKYTTQLIKPHKHTQRDGYSSASQYYHSVLCLGNARGYRIRRTIKYVIINGLVYIHECTFKITETVNHDGLPLHLTQVVYEASLRHQTRTSISLKVIHKNKTKINSISSSIRIELVRFVGTFQGLHGIQYAVERCTWCACGFSAARADFVDI